MAVLFKKNFSSAIVGSVGEKLAENYLRDNGYKILERNFKNNFGKRLGEIDIISKEKDQYVFVEVKTSSFSGSLPEENINRLKLKKLSKIINFYISKNNLWDKSWRIDAISIIFDKNSNNHKINHLKNIFI